MSNRRYQQEAIASVIGAFDSGIQTTLLVMATGTGKTVCFAYVTKEMLGRGRVMILVHREELLNQAVARVGKIVGIDAAVEKAERFSEEDSMHGKPPLVVASVPTLNSGDDALRRLHRFDPMEFSLIVLDEAHHGVAETFKRCLDHFKANPDCKILLVTATADRADERGLKEICEHISYDYDLSRAIVDGYLVPIRQRRVTIEGLEFAKIKTVAGDLNQGELEAVMLAEKPLHGVAHATIEQACGFEIGYLETIRDCPDRIDRIRARLNGRRPKKTLVFTVTVDHAGRLAEIFERWLPKSARVVSAKTPKDEREQMKLDFSAGEFDFLCNVGIWLEGADEPGIEMISMARPTKSRPLYQQCLDDETEILTRGGWRNRTSLRMDDEVATFDTVNNSSAWSPVLAKTDRVLGDGEKMYEFRSPYLNYRVTENHDLLIKMIRGRKAERSKWLKMRAGIVASCSGDYEIPLSAISVAHNENGGLSLTDDELRFIGWFLTDGSVNAKTRQITITQAEHQPQAAEIDKMLNGCGFKYTRKVFSPSPLGRYGATSKTILWTISHGIPRGRDKHLCGWGRLEKYIDKNFSPELEGLNRKQLAVLLHAIHLGDGAKTRTATWTKRTYDITTANRIFADRLQSLCVRRGFRCNIAKHSALMLHISDRQTLVCAGTGAKGHTDLRESPSVANESVWCVTTLHGTIFTRRRGFVTIMGNCVGRGTRPLECIAHKLGELDLASQRVELIRTSAKPHALILDFVGNSGRHKLICTADLLGEAKPQEVIDLAAEIAQDDEVDMAEALEQAEKSIEIGRQLVAMQEEMEAEEADLRDEERNIAECLRRLNVIATATYNLKQVSGFEESQREPPQVNANAATLKQIEFLSKLGCPASESATFSKKQAGAVISSLKEKRGTNGQRWRLRQLGFGPEEIEAMNFDQCSAAIDNAARGVTQ